MQQTKVFGNQGEEAINAWLIQQGFSILARNYQVRVGEIDIIATKNDIIAFVEVKTRHTDYFPLSQTVTYRKQQRIIKAAKHYILNKGLREKVFRFDVATVVWRNNQPPVIEYIPNAYWIR
jgi:putative endonuclease